MDAHAHVFHRALKLAAARRYDPAGDAPLSAYLALLDRLGLANGVLVQPSFLGTDNTFLLECLAHAGGRLRGVAVVAPDIDSDALEALAAAGVDGIRFNLVGASPPDFRMPVWRQHLRRIVEARLHVEVQCRGPEVPGVLGPLTDLVPRVVLDHFGLPTGSDPADSTVRSILAFGGMRQVFVKVSAPYRFLAPAADPAPLVMAYLDAFGPERLLWGSDWPHTQFEGQGDAAGSLRWLGRLLGVETPVYDQVTGKTARTLFAFPASGFDHGDPERAAMGSGMFDGVVGPVQRE